MEGEVLSQSYCIPSTDERIADLPQFLGRDADRLHISTH